MKKLIATTAAALLAAATVSAGDGLKVSGFVRGGISGDLTDMVAANAGDESGDNGTIAATYVGGDHWGGASRGRFNTNYDGDNGGVDFRFQTNINADTDLFDSGNIKFAQAYVKFFDGAVMALAYDDVLRGTTW